MSAQTAMAQLQAELRNLRRQVRTWRAGRATILEPTTAVKLTTVVIYSLCEDASLACVWAQRKQNARRRHDGLWPVTITPPLVQTWHTTYGQHPRVAAAMASFADDLRMAADEFLMESLLAEEVEEQNRKGVTMCPRLMTESFVRKWTLRPRSPATDRWLCLLQQDVNMQANWRRGFKRRWGLEWSNLPGAKCLGTAEIKARTETYLRWVRWMVQDVQETGDYVVVNMDETMLANIKDRRKGIVVNRKRKKNWTTRLKLGDRPTRGVPCLVALPVTTTSKDICHKFFCQRVILTSSRPRAFVMCSLPREVRSKLGMARLASCLQPGPRPF